jgi:hypothetical protein
MSAVAATPAARPGNGLLGAACVALFAAPFVVALIAGAADDTLARLPHAPGTFEVAHGVVSGAALPALLYAALCCGVLEYLRRRAGGSLGDGPRHGIHSLRDVLFAGLLEWVVTWLFCALFVCAVANRALGDVVFETGQVQSKWFHKAKGCHFWISVFGPTVASGTHLCIDEARWKALEVRDALPLVRISSALGEQVGIAPGTVPSNFKEPQQ